MKRLLLGFVPGMAIAATAAAAQTDARPVDVDFHHVGKSAKGWRSGSECYVPLSALNELGLNCRVEGSRLKVEAAGRQADVPLATVAGKPCAPMTVLLFKLGGGTSWSPAGRFEVWSPLRRVRAGAEGIEFESALPLSADVFYLQDPPRVVVDVIGARIGDAVPAELEPNARMGQFKPNVVRIVVETQPAPGAKATTFQPTRSFRLSLEGDPPARATNEDSRQGERVPRSEERPPQSDAAVSATDGDANPYDLFPPVWLGDPIVFVRSLTVLEATASRCDLVLQLGAPVVRPVRFQRPEPSRLEIVLPGSRWSGGKEPTFRAPFVEGIETEIVGDDLVLRLLLSRPMGLELTTQDDAVQIGLIKPNVGDGKLAGKVVVVDAGHGGSDTGARSPDKKVNEKDLNLNVAKLTAARLSEQGATVIMTRKTDVLVPLKERSEIANRNGAHFFVSVHINSTPVPNRTSGGITFYHSDDPICRLLADCIQSELAKVGGIPNLGTWSDTRIHDSGFAVLRYARMPAVLIELGFINHASDRKRLLQKEFQEAAARAIVKGIRVYLGDAKAQEE